MSQIKEIQPPRLLAPASAVRSPLWAAAAATWIDNLGASTALMGVYFVAKRAYDFAPASLFLLGLVQGATYILAALAAGPLTRRLAGAGRPISTRTLLVMLHVMLACVCAVPGFYRSPIAMWIVVGVFSPLSGVLWPMIESFLSAGRTGDDLRRSSGVFNLSWASCQVATFWTIAPFMKETDTALWAIPVMGLSHIAAIPFILLLRPEPAPHGEGAHAHTAEEAADYRRLLHAHRLLLVMSYLVYSALNPLLPTILNDRLRVAAEWATPMTSSWMISRVGMFWLMGAWGGWHGRRATLAWPPVLLLAGLSMSLLAPTTAVLIVGLCFFGLGMGAIYSAAFYYAMEVGSAGVDAGGKHEAFIGVGYTIGPLIGTAAGGVIASGVAAPGDRAWLTLACVLAAAAVFGVRIGKRGARPVRDD